VCSSDLFVHHSVGSFFFFEFVLAPRSLKK